MSRLLNNNRILSCELPLQMQDVGNAFLCFTGKGFDVEFVITAYKLIFKYVDLFTPSK